MTHRTKRLGNQSLRRWTRSIGVVTAVGAGVACLQVARNVSRVRTPRATRGPIDEKVSVLLPARNEQERIPPTLSDLLDQVDLPDVEFLVLDDGSTDNTAEVVRAKASGDHRLRLINGGNENPPSGWLGKTWACHRLGEQAKGSILVFVDADVRFEPHAIAATIDLMRTAKLDFLSPYPRMVAQSWLERVVQPLVVWSWLSFLPLDAVESQPYPSLAAANGQFIVVDAQAYRIVGGHSCVAGDVIEDVGLLRAFKRHGFIGTPGNGAQVAHCRMYSGRHELWAGYTKSLWSAFGSPAGALVVGVMLGCLYVLPPALAAFSRDPLTRVLGTVGFGSAVISRTLVARHTGERAWPDALAHPASVATLILLIGASLRGHRAGTLSWSGRRVG